MFSLQTDFFLLMELKLQEFSLRWVEFMELYIFSGGMFLIFGLVGDLEPQRKGKV